MMTATTTIATEHLAMLTPAKQKLELLDLVELIDDTETTIDDARDHCLARGLVAQSDLDEEVDEDDDFDDDDLDEDDDDLDAEVDEDDFDDDDTDEDDDDTDEDDDDTDDL